MSDEIENKNQQTELEETPSVEADAAAEKAADPAPEEESPSDTVIQDNKDEKTAEPDSRGAPAVSPEPVAEQRTDRRESYPRRHEGGPGRSSRYRVYFRKKVCKFCTQKRAADLSVVGVPPSTAQAL